MQILRKILVLVISITSVLPVKTGNWSIITPLLFSDGQHYEGDRILYPDYSYYRKNVECINFIDNAELALKTIFNQKRITPFYISYDTFVRVMINARFLDGSFYDELTNRYFYWNLSPYTYFSHYRAEAEEFLLNDSMTPFINFYSKNNVNFSLELVENYNEIWTTNEEFLFLINNSEACIKDNNNFYLLNTFYKEVEPFFFKTAIDTSESTTSKGITIPIIIIVIIITVVTTIVCTYVLKRVCCRQRREPLRKSYFEKITDHAWYQYMFYKKKNENIESTYEEPVELHEYAEAGNANRIFYDDQEGNRVNQIMESEKQPEYNYAYPIFKSLPSLGTKDNEDDVDYIEIS